MQRPLHRGACRSAWIATARPGHRDGRRIRRGGPRLHERHPRERGTGQGARAARRRPDRDRRHRHAIRGLVVPESVLTILKFCFLALLYLFLYRVVRVVVSEMRAPAPSPPPAVVATPAPAPVVRSEKARGRAPSRVRILQPP